MKKWIVLICILPLVLVACGPFLLNPTPITIIVTATPPIPTSTPVPTIIPSPTFIPSPTPAPITVSDFEKVLLSDGYIQHPYTSPVRPGKDANSWTKENIWEQILVNKDGYVRLEILDSPSQDTREQHMERKLKVLDQIFPTEFMSELRQANDTYNKSDPKIISGNCPQSWTYNDEWNTEEAQCNASKTTIESFPVAFTLWYLQVTCPPQYSFCYYPDFPGQEFIGENAFTFYDIEINIAP